MIKVIQQDTEERKREFDEKYALYKKLFYTTELPAQELYKKIGVRHSSALSKEIHRMWIKNEEVTPQSRGMLIRNSNWLNKDDL